MTLRFADHVYPLVKNLNLKYDFVKNKQNLITVRVDSLYNNVVWHVFIMKRLPFYLRYVDFEIAKRVLETEITDPIYFELDSGYLCDLPVGVLELETICLNLDEEPVRYIGKNSWILFAVRVLAVLAILCHAYVCVCTLVPDMPVWRYAK